MKLQRPMEASNFFLVWSSEDGIKEKRRGLLQNFVDDLSLNNLTRVDRPLNTTNQPTKVNVLKQKQKRWSRCRENQ